MIRPMYIPLIAAVGASLLAALPLRAENNEKGYRIEHYKEFDQVRTEDNQMYVTVRFKLIKPDNMKVSEQDEVVIREEDRVVKRIPLAKLREQDLTTVLVLDVSGSMAAPANDTDTKRKIDALHEAATRFINLMRPGSKTTLIPFSTAVGIPGPLTEDKKLLIAQIKNLKPEEGTSLYDAAMSGIETLVAANAGGNRVVIVLTDGKDESPGSRYSYEAVIDRAKEAGIKLYMLGLGRKKEINEAVMKRMARETGGEYFYNASADDLLRTFEKVAVLGQSEFTEEFQSTRSIKDGTSRNISIRVEDQTGRSKSNEVETNYHVHGLVVPEQSPLLFLMLLACVAGLLLLPLGFRVLRGAKAHS